MIKDHQYTRQETIIIKGCMSQYVVIILPVFEGLYIKHFLYLTHSVFDTSVIWHVLYVMVSEFDTLCIWCILYWYIMYLMFSIFVMFFNYHITCTCMYLTYFVFEFLYLTLFLNDTICTFIWPTIYLCSAFVPFCIW